MLKKAIVLVLCAAALLSTALAQEGPAPKGVPHLDHLFVIMMENHGYLQVLDNPNEPYLNSLIDNRKVNFAKNYFAIGHPSLTNYLEIVGGSNLGIRSDNAPDWGNAVCTPNLVTGIVNADNAGRNAPIPISWALTGLTVCMPTWRPAMSRPWPSSLRANVMTSTVGATATRSARSISATPMPSPMARRSASIPA